MKNIALIPAGVVQKALLEKILSYSTLSLKFTGQERQLLRTIILAG